MDKVKRIDKLFKLGVISVALLSNSAYSATYDCSNLATWQTNQISVKDLFVKSADQAFKLKWWNKNHPVTHACEWQEWKNLGTYGDVVNKNTPPTLSLISPVSNSSFCINDSAVFFRGAADEDGSVAKVELYLDNIKLSTPYQFTWSATLGDHVLKTIAIDDKGTQASIENIAVAVTARDTTPVNEAVNSNYFY